MVNYMDLLAEFHPGVEATAYGDGSDYDTIEWVSTVVTKATLEEDYLTKHKVDRIEVLSAEAQALIVTPFKSTALGGSPVEYYYDSDAEDQLNLIGSATAGDDMYYPTRIDGVKTYMMHTAAQLKKVVQDGRDVKLSVLQNFTAKKDDILDATTIAEVDAITL